MAEPKGMATCCVCGRDFALISEEHYVACEPEKKGAINALVDTDKEYEYDAFDCPHCGCQNIMQERKKYAVCGELTIESDCDDTEHDGCVDCKYEKVELGGEPCKYCKCSYMDMYERREESDGVKEITR